MRKLLFIICAFAVAVFNSCEKQDVSEQTIIHYTVAVSSSDVTKVTLGSNNRSCYFEDTDVLNITGENISGSLTYVDGWYTTATFSGDLVYTGVGSPSPDLELTATLNSIPASYSSAVSSTLSDAIGGFSYYSGTSTYASKSFTLSQNTSFVEFTVHFSDGSTPDGVYPISVADQDGVKASGDVSVSNGFAKFVFSIPGGTTLNKARATINGKMVKFGSASQTFASGKVYKVEKEFAVTPSYVDLGLSVKWATFNLGATTIYEKGNYYAWGELVPKDRYDDGGGRYKFIPNSDGKLSKYCTQTKDGVNYVTDGKTVLENGDDAAAMALGGGWRMPTGAELNELWTNCTWEWKSNYNGSGVNGILGTSKKDGYTTVTIFLPACGRQGGTSVYGVGENAYYWSSALYTPEPVLAMMFYFNSALDEDCEVDYCGRAQGNCIRPVLP